MKKLFKLQNLLLSILLALVFVSCKAELKPVEDGKSRDSAPPAAVTNLKATAKNAQVLLTWTDVSGEDIFGYEVTCNGVTIINRAISAPAKNSMIVAQGVGGCFISNLTNGTEYTFIVKTINKSGNKSTGATAKATPISGGTGATMDISLSASVPHKNGYTGNKSNSTVTITANIVSSGIIEKVVCKKNGSINAKILLADPQAVAATPTNDNKVWTITLSSTDETANGTYTVAAIDEIGREETAQITIDNFDFTPLTAPSVKVSKRTDGAPVVLTWTEPDDDTFDHVEITYTYIDGEGNLHNTPSAVETVNKGTTSKTFTINGTYLKYIYSVIFVDVFGNKSSARVLNVYVNGIAIPDGFVEVPGTTITGAIQDSQVFIDGRTIVIPDLLVCDHEVTQGEYETYCKYGGEAPYSPYGLGKNVAVYNVSWYDAIIYCNLLSIAENLTPVYKIGGETNPLNWNGIVGDAQTKYCGPSTALSTWDYKGENDPDGGIIADFSADGYRLPTEAEWEYVAREGPALSTNKFSGTNNDSELSNYAWWGANYDNKIHEVKTKAPNSLGVYDMSGNIWEWCHDWYGSINSSTPSDGVPSGSDHLNRGGGGTVNSTYFCDISFRGDIGYPERRDQSLGFRVVRTRSF